MLYLRGHRCLKISTPHFTTASSYWKSIPPLTIYSREFAKPINLFILKRMIPLEMQEPRRRLRQVVVETCCLWSCREMTNRIRMRSQLPVRGCWKRGSGLLEQLKFEGCCQSLWKTTIIVPFFCRADPFSSFVLTLEDSNSFTDSVFWLQASPGSLQSSMGWHVCKLLGFSGIAVLSGSKSFCLFFWIIYQS